MLSVDLALRPLLHTIGQHKIIFCLSGLDLGFELQGYALDPQGMLFQTAGHVFFEGAGALTRAAVRAQTHQNPFWRIEIEQKQFSDPIRVNRLVLGKLKITQPARSVTARVSIQPRGLAVHGLSFLVDPKLEQNKIATAKLLIAKALGPSFKSGLAQATVGTPGAAQRKASSP